MHHVMYSIHGQSGSMEKSVISLRHIIHPSHRAQNNFWISAPIHTVVSCNDLTSRRHRSSTFFFALPSPPPPFSSLAHDGKWKRSWRCFGTRGLVGIFQDKDLVALNFDGASRNWSVKHLEWHCYFSWCTTGFSGKFAVYIVSLGMKFSMKGLSQTRILHTKHTVKIFLTVTRIVANSVALCLTGFGFPYLSKRTGGKTRPPTKANPARRRDGIVMYLKGYHKR